MDIIDARAGLHLQRTAEANTTEQQAVVQDILQDVRTRRDEALYDWTETLDGVRLHDLRVQDDEISKAYQTVSDEVVQTIRQAAAHIRDFHEKQLRQSWLTTQTDGSLLGQKISPLEAAGVYVPGGTAAYPSSMMMGVIPAQVAGVERVVVTTPPDKKGEIAAAVLVAAYEIGVTDIYKIGGAQAVGALAYGTETIEHVDKIVGPGNIFVALAKREVFGTVGIDSIAGPSEIAILADDSAHPHLLAADLLSQAEHDPRASAVLFTDSHKLAEAVSREVDQQLRSLPRREIAEASIRDYGKIYVTDTVEQALSYVNDWAPEHLEVVLAQPWDWLADIRHAGAIFLGPNSSEPVGDYFAGPNHVLPTGGTARFSSPLSTDDFSKKSSIIAYSRQALQQNGEAIAMFARLEGLDAHARAIEKRMEGDADE